MKCLRNKNIYLVIFSLFFIFALLGCEKATTTITVTIKDNDDKVIEASEIEIGSDYIIPNLETEEGYYYIFDLSNNDLVNLKNNIIILATLIPMEKVGSFYIDEVLIKEEKISFEKTFTFPSIPDKVDTYEWVESKEMIDNVYYFSYTLTYKIKSFIVTFYNELNEEIENVTVNYGESATLPNYKEGTSGLSWNGNYTNVTKNENVYASIEVIKKSIKYYDGITELDLNTNEYIVGQGIELPLYTKEGYSFIGWYVSSISLYPYTEISNTANTNIVLYARMFKIEKDKITLPASTYNFTGIAKVAHSSGNGTYVYQPQFPSGPTLGVTLYNWTTSDTSIATVSKYSSITGKKAGYCVLTATLISDSKITINCLIKVTSDGVEFTTEEDANKVETCNVRFYGNDDLLISEQTILKGDTVTYPIPPVVEGFKFVGWDKEPFNIISDTIITAVYEEGNNKYTGKKIAIIGDSISTYQDYIPSGYSCFYPYPTADVNDVNQTWWMQVVNTLGAGLFINNSYSGSCVGAGVSSDSQNSVRLSKLIIGEEQPDYILIYMGSNDCSSIYVSLDNFKNGYENMIKKIKEISNAEIILCSLPKSKLYTEENRILYNEVISNIAFNNDLKILDTASFDLTDYLIDSAHPNKEGMTALAKKIVRELLK